MSNKFQFNATSPGELMAIFSLALLKDVAGVYRTDPLDVSVKTYMANWPCLSITRTTDGARIGANPLPEKQNGPLRTFAETMQFFINLPQGPIEVRLNSSTIATVRPDTVTINDVTFPSWVINDLKKALDKFHPVK